jgi:hypothetical protein
MTLEPDILVARDHDPVALRRGLASGELERLRRGAYRPTAGADEMAFAPGRRRALDRMHAVHRQLRADHVFSHDSAALLWGAPLWTVPTVTHVLQRSRASARSAGDVARHHGLPERWVLIGDLPVTDLTRTVVDCATTMHPLGALVVADWALAKGLDRDTTLAMLDARGRNNGRARGRSVLVNADPGAQSTWETWLRYMALRLGLPRPETQVPVDTRIGRFFVDLGWREHNVFLEFDGKVKYRDGAFGAGYDADDARFDEKVREDAITERLGVRPLRFVAKHAGDPAMVNRRLLAAFPETVRRAARVNRLLPLP